MLQSWRMMWERSFIDDEYDRPTTKESLAGLASQRLSSQAAGRGLNLPSP